MSTIQSETLRCDREPAKAGVDQLKSWLPVDAIIRNDRPCIEWMNMAAVVLAEPFFQQTVDRVRKTPLGAEPVVTDLDALIQLEKISDSLQPSGFIFHSSRCGSTLLANACKSLKNSLVVAEAAVVDKLISRFFTDTDESGTKELLYSVFLRAAISALGQRRFGSERHYFVKFASTSTLQFARIRRIWPNVPAVFLFRDPIEVMVSNMTTVPEWMIVETNPATAAAIIGVNREELTNMGNEEFCARALGRYYAAAEAISDERTLLVSYDDLTPQLLPRLVEFFGVRLSDEESDAIIESTRFHSKNAAGRSSFFDDSQAKRAKATPLIQEMAARWASSSYRKLVSKRKQRSAAV